MRQLIVRAGSACPLFAKLASIVLAMAFTFGCSSDDSNEPGGLSSPSDSGSSSSGSTKANVVYGTDVTYEGETYKTVIIGTQTWFQRNLNYAVDGSRCYSNNEDCTQYYGRLYDWSTAMALPSKCNSTLSTSDADCTIRTPHQGICPSGWHIPSRGEWDALMTAVGGASTAGTKLKANSDLWSNNGKGTDEYGFAALPGGYGLSNYAVYTLGRYGFWWSSSEHPERNGVYADYREMSCDTESAYNKYEDYYGSTIGKSYLRSIRCLKDD